MLWPTFGGVFFSSLAWSFHQTPSRRGMVILETAFDQVPIDSHRAGKTRPGLWGSVMDDQ
jgi:hypothetical protein